MFTKKDLVKEMEAAEAEQLHYFSSALGNLNTNGMTELLNEAWRRGWRLLATAGQKATTLFIFERVE